jgi:hypothetical protein
MLHWSGGEVGTLSVSRWGYLDNTDVIRWIGTASGKGADVWLDAHFFGPVVRHMTAV